MNLRQAIDAYLRHLANERNLAPRTVAAYRHDLERLAGYLGERASGDLGVISDYDLKDYLAWLQEEQDNRAAAIARAVSAFRRFFAWAVEQRIIESDPAARLKSPKRARKLPVFLAPTEARDIVREEDESNPLGPRNRALIALLTMTGLRLSEVVGLDAADVSFEQQTVRVLGKGRKERLVPVNPPLARTLAAWLAERPKPAEGCQALFLDRHGNRITGRMIQYAVRKAVKALGLDPRVSPHKLRHTFATLLYAEATDLRDIQDLLGHASIVSTSVYTHTNVDKVRAAVDSLEL